MGVPSPFDRSIVYKVFQLYLRLCSRKGCFETALNTALLLYSFFPQADPMGCLLHIPFLALSCKRFAAITHIAESGLVLGSLPLILLPNWSFDYALSLFEQDRKEDALSAMKESLLRWPELVRLLAERSVARFGSR